jgi:hypothetical protein
MRTLLLLAVHPIVTVAKLLQPGGVRAIVAKSLLLKQQIIIGNRSRHRAPNLSPLDRFVLDLITHHPFQAPQAIGRSQIADSLLVHRPSP